MASGNPRDYYSILGVSRDATPTELKKAYRREAMKHHPDRNRTDQENAKQKFQEIAKIYEVLKDPAKRKIYDKHGEEGLETSDIGFNADNIDLDSLFKMVFEDDVEDDVDDEKSNDKEPTERLLATLPIDVTLLELYEGTTKQVKYEYKYDCTNCGGAVILGMCSKFGLRHVVDCSHCNGDGFIDLAPQIICRQCNGDGNQYGSARNYEVSQCRYCQGAGSVQANPSEKCSRCDGDKIIQVGCYPWNPRKCDVCGGTGRGSTQQCKTCGGKGTKEITGYKPVDCDQCEKGKITVVRDEKCRQCTDGKNTKRAKKSVMVERGTNDGETIKLKHIDDVYGIVKIKVNCVPQKNIKRKDDDLIIEQTVSLRQALLGGEFMIGHIDGSRLWIQPSYTILQTNGLMKVEGKGMPIKGRDGEFGDLFVKFEIKMPEKLMPTQINAICTNLPPVTHQKKRNHKQVRTATQTVTLSQPTAFEKQLIVGGDGLMDIDGHDGATDDGEKVECKQM